MVILSGDMPESAFEKEVGDIRKLLQESTGGITYEDNWGRRDLSYKLKKQLRGYYMIFNFNAAPTAIKELSSSMRLNPLVLRHLIISLPADYVAGKYKEQMLREPEVADKKHGKRGAPHMKGPERPAFVPKETPKDPEQLQAVEKKLDKILENPDIDVR